MVTPSMVEGHNDSWVGIYGFDYFHKGGSIRWEWVKTNGDGVAFDITGGNTFAPGVYLIRLLPYDTGDMNTVVAYKMVIIEGDTVVSYESVVTDKNLGIAPPTYEGNSSVTVSNDTHSLTVNKTKFDVGEEILVSAVGVHAKDWIGIAQRNNNEATIRWYYIADVGNGEKYDIRSAPNIGGNLGHLKDLPEGPYTIYLVEKDGYLKNGYTFSINVSIGDIEDADNGKTEGGTQTGGNTPAYGVIPPISAVYVPSINGYAAGTVEVTMPIEALNSHNIVMYWGNENGILEGYTPHARFKATSTTASYTFTKSVIIPKDATKLLIYSQKSSTGEMSSEYVTVELPQGSQMNITSNKITSFYAISDVHIGSANGAKHFELMLKDAVSLNPNGVAIFIAGDIADNGREDQYAQAVAIHSEVMTEMGVSASDYPMFFAIGNHDYPAATSAFLSYAVLPDGSHPTDTCYDFWFNGYHYIMLGSDSPSGLNATFTEETLAWLDTTLAQGRSEGKPIFIFLHQPMFNTVSGSLPGEGWHGVTNEDAFKAVISKYPEIIMFNGHTHWEMNSKGNMFDATEELPINIFNCASVSYLWSGFNKTTGEHLDGSQGYYVELYSDRVVVKGRDFVNAKWIASAQYCVELQQGTDKIEHNYEIKDITYSNGYGKAGKITYECLDCHIIKEEIAPALIECLGYSMPEDGRGQIAIGFNINSEAIKEYEEITGKTLKYGAFAVAQEKLGTNDIFDENGTVANFAITAEITSYEFSSFELKITGFTDEYKDDKLALGAYVIATDKDGTEYSYIQHGEPKQNEKYVFTSYDEVVNS